MKSEERHRARDMWSLVTGPFVGLLYAIALPFIGIATVAALLVRKVLGGVVATAGNLCTFGWRPLEAHLGGKRKERKRKEENPK